MELARSALAPTTFPNFSGISGVQYWAVESNIRYSGRPDLALISVKEGSVFAGVFTQSACRSAAVDHCRGVLERQQGRAIIINSGNANAFTGMKGVQGNIALASIAAEKLNCDRDQVFTASTGVIGEALPFDKLEQARHLLKTAAPGSLRDVAKAIRTTDTFSKGACIEVEIDGVPIRIEGVAKGSGMIAPDMATMLAFIFTDAVIDQSVLQHALYTANSESFSCITVDSDTSTSDTCLLGATQQAGNTAIIDTHSDSYRAFSKALQTVLVDLAQQIVRDGEGAQKFIKVCIEGAVDDRSAKNVAFSIANSPLVKTAIAGEDANWGRVIMAVGKAGEPADRDILSVAMGGIIIAENGEAAHDYAEARVIEHLAGQEVTIEVNLNLGPGKSTVYTCDLTHGYIDINADYRS